MPGGKAHALASVAGAAVSSVFVLAASKNALFGLSTGLGCLSGVLLTPDLDQEGISAAEWRLVKATFGLGFVWLALWWPYAFVFRHRGVSHWPIIGTLTRLAYLGGFWVIIWLILGRPDLPRAQIEYLGFGVAGLMLSDLLHCLMDTFWKG